MAFIFRGREYTKQAILSARSSFDLNDRSLSYHWSVLRGASEHVRITPLAADASVVRVEIDYHPETTIEDSTRLTNNVEIGAFVCIMEYTIVAIPDAGMGNMRVVASHYDGLDV